MRETCGTAIRDSALVLWYIPVSWGILVSSFRSAGVILTVHGVRAELATRVSFCYRHCCRTTFVAACPGTNGSEGKRD